MKGKKRVLIIIAAIALIAALGVCLVACNESGFYDRLVDAGYDVERGYSNNFGKYEVQWYLSADKYDFEGLNRDYVYVIRFKNSKDADEWLSEHEGNYDEVTHVGTLVIAGTEQGVIDAK